MKVYGLIKKTSRGLLLRHIIILGPVPNKVFLVLVQDRLWMEASPTPMRHEEHSKIFPTHAEAVAEADKNFADSRKAGFKPMGE
jgi:hypothetical protein